MQPTQAPCPDFPVDDRRTPALIRQAPPVMLVELADAEDFRRLAQRQALRCRRNGEMMAVLALQVQFDAEPDEALRQQLLLECARRLCGRVRSTDVVAHWQGTHFGVLLLRCQAVNAEVVLARLIRSGGGVYRLGELRPRLQLQGQVQGAARNPD
jgi:GGDEF domain-containing protein